MLNLGLLCTQIKVEEKLLMEEAGCRVHNVIKADMRDLVFGLENYFPFDVVLARDFMHPRDLCALFLLEKANIRTVNSYDVARRCSDKVAVSKLLRKNGISTPDVLVAFTPESALQAMDRMGYPVILKPAVGTWGQLLAKVNDREGAEALLEHKDHLGSYYHSIFYMQKYIPKPGRDIQVIVVGDEVVCAIYRVGKHWITHPDRGAEIENCPVTKELQDLALKAARAVGGGVLSIDVMETKDGLTVHEVNGVGEFRHMLEPTGVNIPAKILDYVEKVTVNV
ncbi:RimK family alpha-L-glutamate ligase [Candidatus Acetothermia bacterium]|nr:RimK family alpha-L-glutamate ligase [Candidatus Acetothermia bacterium]